MNKDNLHYVSQNKINDMEYPYPIHDLKYRWFKIKDGKYIEYDKITTILIEDAYKSGKKEFHFKNCYIDFSDFTERRSLNCLNGLRIKRIENDIKIDDIKIDNNTITNDIQNDIKNDQIPFNSYKLNPIFKSNLTKRMARNGFIKSDIIDSIDYILNPTLDSKTKVHKGDIFEYTSFYIFEKKFNQDELDNIKIQIDLNKGKIVKNPSSSDIIITRNDLSKNQKAKLSELNIKSLNIRQFYNCIRLNMNINLYIDKLEKNN